MDKKELAGTALAEILSGMDKESRLRDRIEELERALRGIAAKKAPLIDSELTECIIEIRNIARTALAQTGEPTG